MILRVKAKSINVFKKVGRVYARHFFQISLLFPFFVLEIVCFQLFCYSKHVCRDFFFAQMTADESLIFKTIILLFYLIKFIRDE